MTTTTNPDPSGVLTMPTATPGAVAADPPAAVDANPATVPAAPPASPPASAAVDQAGVAFDPIRHEVDKATGTGKLSRLGRWMLKRGNGARVAAGKPMAGATSTLVIPKEALRPADQVPGPVPAAPAANPGQAGTAPLPTGPVQVSVAPPAAPAPLDLEAYESTAVGVAHGVWAVAQMAGGPKWEPTSDEVSAWSKALQRVWHHYQLPIVGPLVELVILAFRSSAKRTDSRQVRGLFAKSWRWARGGRFNDPADEQRPTQDHG